MKISYSIVCVCVMLLCGAVVPRVGAAVADDKQEEEVIAKRETDKDLEKLLHELEKHGDSSEDVAEKDATSLKDDQAPLENLMYESRSDIFIDKRWMPVYADTPTEREGRAMMNSVTTEQHKAIVDMHNKLRRQEGAANMEALHYNAKLARLAQTWSQRCVFEHGQPPFSQSDVGFKNLGQNIFAHSKPDFKVEDAVQAWYDEKKDYHYDTTQCNSGKICGHYTAVTWAKTTEIGCGMTFCPMISGIAKAHFIVCNYAPAGNFQGEKNYQKGQACTKCDSGKFYCDDNLCDSSCNAEGAHCQCKAACQKCSKKTSKCGCECGKGSTGPDCSESCADKDPKCGANPGYPSFLCTMSDPNWAFVKEKCPKLCKKCEAGNPCQKRKLETMSQFRRAMISYLDTLEHEDESSDKK